MKSKEVKDLMEAYASIYMEQEQLVEGAEEYAGGQHPSKHPDKKVRDRYETETRRRQAPKNVGVPDKSVGYGGLKDDVDLFDIVKGYLLDEGHAETEEEALYIMANMSEEWRQSIIEGLPIPPGGIKPDRMNPVDSVTGKPKYKMITGPTGKPREIENPSFGMVKGA